MKAGERIYSIRGAVMVLRENHHRDGDNLSSVWSHSTGKVDITNHPLIKGQTLSKTPDREKWEALKAAGGYDRCTRL
jgi:hypothetical protein